MGVRFAAIAAGPAPPHPASIHAACAPVTPTGSAGRMVGKEYVRAMVAFLTNDGARVRAGGRLVSSGPALSTGQIPRSAAVPTGSLRVRSRNRRRGLARNGPLGAAVELPGGCRRRAPTRRSVLRVASRCFRDLCWRIRSTGPDPLTQIHPYSGAHPKDRTCVTFRRPLIAPARMSPERSRDGMSRGNVRSSRRSSSRFASTVADGRLPFASLVPTRSLMQAELQSEHRARHA